jgi:hypothetical protein
MGKGHWALDSGDWAWSLLRSLLICLLPIAQCLVLTACGYQFQVEGPGPTIGPSARPTLKGPAKPPPRVRVTTLENKAFEPNLEVNYTSYIRREFSSGSGATVVSDGEPADLVLKGQILLVSLPALSFTQVATLENRVSVIVKVIAEDTKTGKVIWDRMASGSSEFFLTNDLQFNRVLQTRALEQAGRMIAQDLATQFLNFLDVGPEPQKMGVPGPLVPSGTPMGTTR